MPTSCGPLSARVPTLPAQAAAEQWPHIFATPEAEVRKAELVEKMRAVRPVVETGCVLAGLALALRTRPYRA
jgi:hypothetical protein